MKKLLIYLVSVSMMSSFFCLPLEGMVSAKQTDEVPGDDSSSALTVKLHSLGVLSDDEVAAYEGTGSYTRGDMAELIYNIVGRSARDTSIQRVENYLTDVTPDDAHYNAIAFAYTSGIMIGDENAYFHPNDRVTYEEVIKIGVVTLGYNIPAEASGGFVGGYMKVAAESGLLDGVKGNNGDIDQANILKFIDNMLDEGMYVVTSFEDNTPKIEKDDTKTLLNTYMGMEEYEGIVTAYEYSSLMDDSEEIGDNVIEIGSEKFECYGNDYAYLIGSKVHAYYTTDDEYEIRYIEQDRKNSILNVNATDIDESTTLSHLEYYKNNTKRTAATFDSDALFMFNGKRLNSPQASDLLIDAGTVSLVDNDNDNKYEVVLINSYDVEVCDGIIALDEIVKLKFGHGKLSVKDSDNVRARFWVDGSSATLSDISKGNVLSIKRSRNTTGTILCDIYATTASEDATLSAIESNDDGYTITTTDNNIYNLSKSYIKRVNNGDESSVIPQLNKDMTLYFDMFGDVAAVIYKSAGKNYAYVVKCYYDTVEEVGYIRLFTKDSEFKTIQLKEKMTLNDVRVTDAELPNKLKETTIDGTVNQLVVFSETDDGMLTSIRTAEDKSTDGYHVTGDDEFILNCKPSKNASTGNWYGMRFYKNLAENYPFYWQDGITINFQIPTNPDREKDYKITTKLSSTDVSLGGPIYIYDAMEGGMVSVVVSGIKEDNNFSLPAIVSSVQSAIDEDGIVAKKLVFFDGTSVFVDLDETKYNFPTKLDNGYKVNWGDRVDYSSTTVDMLKKGDVIEYTTTNDGYIDTVRVLYTIDNPGLSRVDGDHLAKNGNMICTAYSVSTNNRSCIVEYNDYTGQDKYQSMFVNGTVFRVNTDTREIEYSSTADIQEGDTLLINTFWWSSKMVIIFR